MQVWRLGVMGAMLLLCYVYVRPPLLSKQEYYFESDQSAEK